MRPSFVLLASAILLGSAFSAHASDITYDIVGGTLSPSGSFSGYFNINATTEYLDGGSITATAPGGGTTYTFTSSTPAAFPGGETFTDSLGDSFRLYVGGTIGNLTLNTFSVNGAGGDTELTLASGAVYNATAGLIAPTPEPSSLLLLGSGILGLAAAGSRRIFGS